MIRHGASECGEQLGELRRQIRSRCELALHRWYDALPHVALLLLWQSEQAIHPRDKEGAVEAVAVPTDAPDRLVPCAERLGGRVVEVGRATVGVLGHERVQRQQPGDERPTVVFLLACDLERGCEGLLHLERSRAISSDLERGCEGLLHVCLLRLRAVHKLHWMDGWALCWAERFGDRERNLVDGKRDRWRWNG